MNKSDVDTSEPISWREPCVVKIADDAADAA